MTAVRPRDELRIHEGLQRPRIRTRPETYTRADPGVLLTPKETAAAAGLTIMPIIAARERASPAGPKYSHGSTH